MCTIRQLPFKRIAFLTVRFRTAGPEMIEAPERRRSFCYCHCHSPRERQARKRKEQACPPGEKCPAGTHASAGKLEHGGFERTKLRVSTLGFSPLFASSLGTRLIRTSSRGRPDTLYAEAYPAWSKPGRFLSS